MQLGQILRNDDQKLVPLVRWKGSYAWRPHLERSKTTLWGWLMLGWLIWISRVGIL